MDFSVLLSSLLIFLAVCDLQRVCGNAELRVLMEMKSSLDPENRVLSSWTNEGDPCSGSFEGVACNEHRKVANISLQGKRLSGEVPPAVAGLKCLSGLYLHYNALSGNIPSELSNLTELVDLYLDFNNLSGTIPPQIGSMSSLQVLQLCCNQLNGSIPTQIGSLKRLSALALQQNRLTGSIPVSIGNLGALRRLDLGFNGLSGSIPAKLADISQLEYLNVQNNTLLGVVPPGLKRLNEGLNYGNNLGLCGSGFPSLRNCSTWDDMTINVPGSTGNNGGTKDIPGSVNFREPCNQTHCSNSSKFPQIRVVAGVVIVSTILAIAGFLMLICYRRQKQKIGSSCDPSDGQLSTATDQAKEFSRKTASPLVSLEYSNGWDSFADGLNGNGYPQDFLQNFRFNLEEVESATQYFSELNLLRRTNFSSVYRGALRDGSLVAIRSLNVTSCKSEEAEFVKGLNLLTSLRHENLVRLRGFCCSRSRGECFLIYDYAPNGNLSRYLDVQERGHQVLDWPTRVSIITGIARGIGYLHSSQPNKPALIHQNISAEKVLIDQHFNPLISDSGLPRLLADDIVFSTLKVSAAMGYLAPEYITTGRFTEKSDIFAFGVIVLQTLSGTQQLSSSMRVAAESHKYSEFIDKHLPGKFSESEAAKLAKIALACTNELADQRPTMEAVIQELNNCHFP